MTNSEVLKIRVSPATRAGLEEIARAEGTNISALMRQQADAMLIPEYYGEWE